MNVSTLERLGDDLLFLDLGVSFGPCRFGLFHPKAHAD